MSTALVRARPVPYPRGAAVCRGADPEMFFPLGSGGNSQARATCYRCPIREECLEYALAWDVHGIWGGTTYRQRRRMRAARGVAPLPVLTHRPDEETPSFAPLELKPTPDFHGGHPMVPITVGDARALVLLADGHTAQEAADQSGVKLSHVMRLARGQGWDVHPTTGLASDKRREDGKPVVADHVTDLACQPTGAEPDEPHADPEPEPPMDLSAAPELATSVDELLHAARHLGDKKVTAALDKAETAIGKLRDLYEETAARIADDQAAAEARAAALAEVERLREALAAAEQKAAEAGAKVRKKPSGPRPASGPSTKDIRAWARQQGIDVPDRGRIPGDVLVKYQAAHAGIAA